MPQKILALGKRDGIINYLLYIENKGIKNVLSWRFYFEFNDATLKVGNI